MTNFLALYRGNRIGDAQLVAVTADAALVALVAEHIIGDAPPNQHEDAVLNVLQQRRLDALRIVARIDDPGEDSPDHRNGEDTG